MVKWCPKCKSYASINQVYCTRCGTKTKVFPKCQCGAEIMPANEFCEKCGTYLRERLTFWQQLKQLSVVEKMALITIIGLICLMVCQLLFTR